MTETCCIPTADLLTAAAMFENGSGAQGVAAARLEPSSARPWR